MIITVGGYAGSGKSSLAKRLAKELGYDHYSIGDLQRELASEHGMTIKEWGEYEKDHPEFDQALDDKQKKLGEEKDNFVIDGWLARHFIPHSVKLFLTGDERVRAERINNDKRDSEEKNVTVEERIDIMKERQQTARDRWIEFYGFDWMDTTNYDFVVDTTNLGKDEVFKEIMEFVKAKIDN